MMILQTLGLQLFLTAISAVLGAGVLLWLQTKYERVKLLRGIEEEVQQNLYTVGKVGTLVYEQQDPKVATRYKYYDNIYRAVMADSPILYTRLLKGISPVPDAYRDIAQLQSLGGVVQPSASVNEFLKFLENLEDELIESGNVITEIQQDSLFYQLYSRFWLREELEAEMGMYSVIESSEEGMKEKNWRPSGKATNEKQKN